MSYGYWTVSRNFEDLNKAWCVLRDKVVSGELSATGATCSTLRYHPSKCGPGPQTTGIIKILTKFDNFMDVGLKLINLDEIQHDIRHRTIHQRTEGPASHSYADSGVLTQLFWNDGLASTTQKGLLTHSPHRSKYDYDPSEDDWKLHIARGTTQGKIHGKWIVPFGSLFGLTHLWHKLKYLLETAELRAEMMECVAPRKRLERPAAIHLFTAKEEVQAVGEMVLPIVERDISYVQNDHVLKWRM